MSFLEQLEDPRGRTSGPSVAGGPFWPVRAPGVPAGQSGWSAGTRLAGELLEDEQRQGVCMALEFMRSNQTTACTNERFQTSGCTMRNHLSSGLLLMYEERRNLHSCSLRWSGRNLQLAQLVSVGEVAQLEESFRLGFSLCDVCHHYKNDGLCIMTYSIR